MNRKWLLPIALIVGLASCESADSPFAVPAHKNQFAVVPGADGKQYTLVEGQLPAPVPSASGWIGKEGGTVALYGGYKDGRITAHAIFVPEGAVNKPTLFTITLGSNQFVTVDLHAEQPDNRGNMKDVGKNGFRKPVYLFLTYAWATNVSDPSKLTILYDPENGNAHQKVGGQVLFGFDKYVFVELSHFSKYAMAMD